MPSAVNKLPDEPIILVTESGHVDIEHVRSNRQRINAIAREIDGAYHIIIDARESDSSFADVMKILRSVEPLEIRPASSCYVGSSVFLQLYRNALSQIFYGKSNLPIFESLEAAMLYTREQVAAQPAKISGYTSLANDRHPDID